MSEAVEIYKEWFEANNIDPNTVSECWVTDGMMCFYTQDGEFNCIECDL